MQKGGTSMKLIIAAAIVIFSVIKFEFKPKSMYLSKIPKIGEKANVSFVQYSNTLGSFAFVSNNRDELINDIKKFLKEYKVEY